MQCFEHFRTELNKLVAEFSHLFTPDKGVANYNGIELYLFVIRHSHCQHSSCSNLSVEKRQQHCKFNSCHLLISDEYIRHFRRFESGNCLFLQHTWVQIVLHTLNTLTQFSQHFDLFQELLHRICFVQAA